MAVSLYVGKTIKKSQMFYDFFGKNKECISERGMKNETDSDNMIYNISFGRKKSALLLSICQNYLLYLSMLS